MNTYDVLIIGAGITGSLLTRNLSKYELKIALLDKENDVGNVTTNANSAIIHSGYDPKPGSLKAKMNKRGNELYDQIAKELDVPFERIGSLTLAMEDDQVPTLYELLERSKLNGVEVKILNKEETLKIEPNLSPDVKGSLLAPTAGIIDPFNLSVHAVENACDNGAELFLNQEVIAIKKVDGLFEVKTKKGTFYSRVVVDAAGCYSDKIAEMIELIDWKITPRKGEYYVLNHFKRPFINHVVFPLPSEKGKGVLISKTYSGDYIIGPSSEPVDDKDDVSTDKETLQEVARQANMMCNSIPYFFQIRAFAGNRPTCTRHDFVIEHAKSDDHFIILGGIESPGLASSPAISEYVIENLIRPIIDLKEKTNFNPYVRKHIRPNNLSTKERDELVKSNPEYGEIVCNCEHISLAEMKDELNRSCPPRSIKAMKRRVRAGYGKCQGGMCMPKVLLLLAKHYNVDPSEILYDGEDSEIILSKIKEVK